MFLGGHMEKFGRVAVALMGEAAVYFGFHHWIGLTVWFTAGTIFGGLGVITDAIRDKK